MNENTQGKKPNLVPAGTHSTAEYNKLKSKLGVYRCLLRPVLKKRDPKHADYRGILNIANGQASVLIWTHADGTLGLRLEKITPRTEKGVAK